MRGKSSAVPELLNLADAGHFDLMTPGTAVSEDARSRIEAALNPAR
jgi:hypothetical protein